MRRRRGRQGSAVGVSLGIGVVLAIVGLLVLSPRHRHFYSRLFEGSSPSEPTVTTPAPPAPAARPLPSPPAPASQPQAPPASPPSARPPGFASPIVPEAGTPRPELPPVREPSPKPSKAVVAVARPRPGEPVLVKIVDELVPKLPLSGPPPGWELKEFAGRAQVDVVRDEGRVAFRLGSERTSFALYRDVALDVKDFPLLTWSWKVTKLPTGGDIRERTSDDQAAQVYVIFPRWPFPRINSDVVGYIWDSRAPVGLKITSPQSSNVKLTVLESGAARLGKWIQEERNVYQDYVDLFGKEPPQAGKVAIMIDSNDTRSEAEAFFGDLAFHPLKR